MQISHARLLAYLVTSDLSKSADGSGVRRYVLNDHLWLASTSPVSRNACMVALPWRGRRVFTSISYRYDVLEASRCV